MTKGPEVTKAHDSEPSKIYAKNSWYGAYLKAGTLIPQVRFGPHLPTLRAVLSDLPDGGWQTVALSMLTDQQVKRSATVMNNLHAAAGIDLYTSEFSPVVAQVSERRRSVTPEALQREWSKTVAGLQYSVYGFLTDSTFAEDLPSGEAIEQVNALLYDPNNHSSLNQLHHMVDAGCKALDETRMLAELFRLGHSDPTVREKQLAEKGEIYSPYFQLYGLTHDMIADPNIALGKIVGRVQEAFVPFNNPRSRWLLYGTGLKVG